MRGYVGLVCVGFGLVFSLCLFGVCGLVSILADVDHVVGIVQECGFPPGLLCLLAAYPGRPWHWAYLWISGFVWLGGSAFVAGLLVGAVHTRNADLEADIGE